MSRKNLENIATSIGLISLFTISIGSIISIADGIFALDILPSNLEKFVFMLIGILFITVVCSVMVSVMLNISIIANSMKDYIDSKNKEND